METINTPSPAKQALDRVLIITPKKQLRARVAMLTHQRDALIAEANRQVAHLNGRIAELQELIADTPPADA